MFSASTQAKMLRDEVHRLYLKNTTDASLIMAMWKAHEAQMRRNRLKKKGRVQLEGQIGF